MFRRIVTAVVLAFALAALVAVGQRAQGPVYQSLTDAEMAELLGACGACRNCHSASDRFDECRHTTLSNPNNCQTDMCIENVVVGSTCDLGSPQDCSAVLDPGKPQIVQYVRQDTNCTWSTANYHDWVTHYYDGTGSAPCPKQGPWQVACDKTNGQCNGTLDHTNNRGTKIICQ